jgi:hypothetical protein
VKYELSSQDTYYVELVESEDRSFWDEEYWGKILEEAVRVGASTICATWLDPSRPGFKERVSITLPRTLDIPLFAKKIAHHCDLCPGNGSILANI